MSNFSSTSANSFKKSLVLEKRCGWKITSFFLLGYKDFTELYEVLPGPTAIMLSDAGNVPAKLIKSFRKKNDKPILKAAFVEESIYIGDDQLQSLVDIKSKDELIGEIIGLLQSPAKNVLSALTSGKSTIAGIVKTLSEKDQ